MSTATRALRLGGRTLREHAARGTVVNAVFLVALSVVGMVRGFVLAGLVTQTQYGVWGVIVIALGTLLLFKQIGVADRYIQQDEPDQEAAFQRAFTIELAFTAIFLVLLVVAVPVAAVVYGSSAIVAPGLVVCLVLPAGALQAPLWIHYRNMDFVRQRLLQALDPIIGFVGAVLAGGWATAIATVATSPYRLRWRWDGRALRAYASFSWPLFVASGAGVLMIQAAMLGTTRHLGLAAAGAVALAANISQFSDRVDAIVSGTLYPAICAVRERTDLLFESFVKTNRISLMWAVPFGVGASLFASDLVHFALGSRWHAAVPLLQAFGLTAALGHLGFNWNAYFRATGQTRPVAVHAVVGVVAFLAVGLPLLFAAGLEGLAAGVGAMALACVVCRAYYLRRIFPGFRMIGHAARAIAPTIPAAAAVLAVRLVESGPRTFALAAAEVVLYAAVTVAATLRFERGLVREAVGLLRRGIS